MIPQAKTLVVKVGSSLVTNEGRGLDTAAIGGLAGQVAELRRLGKSAIIVSSGAIAEGMQRLGWARRPHAMHELQAAAAVGQMGSRSATKARSEATGCTARRCCSRTPTSPTASAT